MNAQINLGLKGVKFDVLVKRAKTGKTEIHSKGHNLILDQGLDQWATSLSSHLTRYCAVGSGTDPVERDSATTTATRSGTTVTADGSFFEAGDVGRLIRWDTGEEDYIQTFTSATVVETVGSGAVAAGEFTIYYVDDNGLQTELKRSTTYRTDSGDNGSSLSAGVITHKRTHTFTAEASPVTYNEIGWSPSSGAGANLFNRAIISGGVSLGIGDQLIVVSNMEIVQSPQTAVAQSNVGSGGFDTTGDAIIEGVGIAAVASTGAPASFSGIDGSAFQLEPADSPPQIRVSNRTTALGPYGTPKTGTPASFFIKNGSNGSYANGQFYRDKLVTYDIGEANFNDIRSIEICRQDSSQQNSFRVLLDTNQTKLNTQTLLVRFRLSWQRDFS